MIVAIDKTYKTRCGYDVKIYAIQDQAYAVHGAYFVDNEWRQASWAIEGKYSIEDSKYDLLEAEPTPDEIAAKDAEIERLRAELAKKDRIIECKDEALADARDRELGLLIECNKLIMFYNNVVDQAFFISEEILNDRKAD